MTTSHCPPFCAHDYLARNQLVPPPAEPGRFAPKIGLAVLIGLLLALAAGSGDGPLRSAERLAGPGEQPPIVARH
jgi:hypothetical protein